MTHVYRHWKNEDVIDSRDIIARIDELASEMEDLKDEIDSSRDDWAEALEASPNGDLEERICAKHLNDAVGAWIDWVDAGSYLELKLLKGVAKECESMSSDWEHGETLIRETYWVEYIKQLIEDCYTVPTTDEGEWPYSHMTMDYEAAAEEALVDYSEVMFDEVIYYIRSC